MPKIAAASLAEHRETTRAALYTALDELLAESTFDQITLGAIATRAGVSRTAVYNYAPDKAALLHAAAAESAERFADLVETLAAESTDPTPDLLAEMLRRQLLSHAAGVRRLIALEVDAPESSAVAEAVTRIRSITAAVIDRGAAEGTFAPSGDRHLDVLLLAGMVEVAVRQIAVFPLRADAIVQRTIALSLAALQSPAEVQEVHRRR